MRLKVLFCLLLFVLSLLCAQDARQDPLLSRQTNLSSAVWEALDRSEQSMNNLEIHYNTMIDSYKKDLSRQDQDISTLERHLNDTMNLFKNLSAEFWNLSLKLAREQAKVRTLLIIAGVIIAAKIAAFALYALKVPIPRWLDIVL